MYRVANKATYEQLKKMAMRQKQLNASINTTGAPKVPENQAPPPPNKRKIPPIQLISRKEIR